MKAFEVKQKIRGGHKDQTRTIFVEANSKKELMQDPDTVKVWERQDMKPDDCPMMFDGRWIEPKEDFCI